MHDSIIKKIFATEEALVTWAKQIAPLLNTPLSIGISGEIGMGKTTLCRALIRALGVSEVIKSPTFTWLETYKTAMQILHHVDLYRLEDDVQYYRLNLEEYVGQDLILIEWPEKSQKVLSWLDVHGKLKALDTGRILELQSYSERGKNILSKLQDL